MDALKSYVAKKATKLVIEAVLSQKEQIKKSFEEMLDKTDLPIPDHIEQPLDELIEVAFNEALNQVCAQLEKLL